MNIMLILCNIRSNENVGSIFRTSDAFRIKKIFLCGYTPAPLDRFERPNGALSKSALGAEKFVPWERSKNLGELVKNLKSEKFEIIGVEQSQSSINYKSLKKFFPTQNLALVFGNEVKGLSKKDLSLCSAVAEIPMKGKKESLNVSVAVGIVLSSLSE